MSQTSQDRRDAYRARNAELFAQRIDILDELAKPRVTKVKSRRLRRELERVDTAIVEHNQGLVGSQLNRWRGATSARDMEELRAVANAGLWEAISTYDPDKGPFGQWGQLRIRSSLMRAVRAMDHATIGRTDFERRPRIRAAVAELSETPEAGDVAAIARIADVPVGSVERVLGAARVSSLNAPVGTSGDETTELGDQIVDDGTVDAHAAVETGIGIDAVRNYGLGCLPPRELYVMTRVWGLDGEPADSLSTIGDVLGVTREAARQTHNRAMSRLTHPHTLRKIMQARHGELAGV